MKKSCCFLLAFVLLVAVFCGSPARADIDLSTGNASMDQAALDKLVKRAQATHSDSLVVFKNGNQIGEWYFGHDQRPINTRSITKSIVSLAIGCLIDEGKIKSLDEPIYDFYPEWNQGYKKFITIHHILAQTSGIDASEEYNCPDVVQLAVAAELKSKPGARFLTNNKAVNILAGIVKIASGKPIDQYISEKIFSPLGIGDDSWERDRAGNPEIMAGVSLNAMDLAKIGQMTLNGGTWQGQRIVSSDWIDKSTSTGVSANPWYGLLWWILYNKVSLRVPSADDVKQFNLSSALVQKITALKDRQWDPKTLDRDCKLAFGSELFRQWNAALQDGLAVIASTPPPIGFKAEGYMGQNLIVLPSQQLVVVRQISKDDYKSSDDDFADIVDYAKALTVK